MYIGLYNFNLKIIKKLILSVIIILSSLSLEAQIGFKSKKLGDKMTGKFLDKTSKMIGIDDNLIFRKKFDFENYHYRYENDTISFTLDFISAPNTGLNSKNECENFDAVLSIRNKGGTDIKFRQAFAGTNRLINKKKLEDNLAPPLSGIYQISLADNVILQAISDKKGKMYGTIDGGCEFKNRIYAAGDPNSIGDIEASTIYIRYKVELYGSSAINNSLDFKFQDEFTLNLFDYEPSYVKLTANTNWTRNWRDSDQDYNTRLSEYLTENNVGGVFGNKKNKKDKKKN